MQTATKTENSTLAKIQSAIKDAANADYENITEAQYALLVLSHEYGAKALAEFIDNNNGYYALDKLDEWQDDFTDSFIGKITLREYAEQIAEDVFGLSPELTYYFDYDKYADALRHDYCELNGYLFRSI
jgi:hypothetical protein